MSWGTNLYTSIYFNKRTYNSKYEVESDLEDVNNSINLCKENLRDLAIMTEPNKFFTDTESNPLLEVTEAYRDNMELLEEYIVTRYKLQLLLDNWDDCHNKDGLAIEPPDTITYDTSYLEGDFIKSVNNPNKNKTL